MSIPILVLGQSGTGKSTSLRNLDPKDVLLIKVIEKPLPFRSKEWKKLTNEGGSIYVSDKAETIMQVMHKCKRPIIIIDDFQYVMANEFMRRSSERGFDKFTEIGKNTWDILTEASKLSDDKRVYILSHTEEDQQGKTKIKTIGKMLDEKITLEGMVTVCLQTTIINGQYRFMTENNGNTTVKSPMGMFESEHIDNDLSAVDKAICEFYEITNQQQEAAQ